MTVKFSKLLVENNTEKPIEIRLRRRSNGSVILTGWAAPGMQYDDRIMPGYWEWVPAMGIPIEADAIEDLQVEATTNEPCVTEWEARDNDRYWAKVTIGEARTDA